MSHINNICTILSAIMGQVVEIEADMNFSDIPNWDSFKSVEFLIELEAFYQIRISADQIDKIITINDVLVLLGSFK